MALKNFFTKSFASFLSACGFSEDILPKNREDVQEVLDLPDRVPGISKWAVINKGQYACLGRMPLDSRICTTKELQDILRSYGGIFVFPQKRYNEVYPRVFIGDGQTALDIRTLTSIGITHVLNASEGSETYKGFVNTGASYYSSAGIKYKGFPAYDNLSYDLSQHFSEAADFIDDALKSNGRVLVHCYMGVSRSATLVLAFLMLKRAMTAQDAIKVVRSKREINPNSNFLQQLCNLNQLLMSRCF